MTAAAAPPEAVGPGHQLEATTDAAAAARTAEAQGKVAKTTASKTSSGSRSRSHDDDGSMIGTVVESTACKPAARPLIRERVQGIVKRS